LVLEQASEPLRRVIAEARDKSLAFQDSNFRDLGDFAARVAELAQYQNFPKVAAAAQAVREHIMGHNEEPPMLRVGFVPQYARATGMSVYLPPNGRSYAPQSYRHLAFARATGWDRMLDWLCVD
jgi:hypothetical protein